MSLTGLIISYAFVGVGTWVICRLARSVGAVSDGNQFLDVNRVRDWLEEGDYPARRKDWSKSQKNG